MLSTTVTPRFGDIDGLRHINNTKLPEWFELARMPLYRIFHPDLNLDGWSLIMARIAVDFTAQMTFDKEVEIRTWVSRIGRSSFTVSQEAWQDGVLAARGEAVIVHYDFAGLSSLAIPDARRHELSQHLVEPQAGENRTSDN